MPIPYWPERPLIRKIFRKIKCMIIILIAPEFGVGMAVDEFLAARQEVRRAKDRFPEEEQALTLTHGFYSIMGGYARAESSNSSGSRAESLNHENWFEPRHDASKDSPPSTRAYSALQLVDNGTMDMVSEQEHGTERDEGRTANHPPQHAQAMPGTSWQTDQESFYELDLRDYGEYPDRFYLQRRAPAITPLVV